MSATSVIDAAPGCPSGMEPALDASVIDPAPFVRLLRDGTRQLELSVYGAKCGGCIAKIEGGLKILPGIDAARLNLSTGKLAITWRDADMRPRDITQKISDLGYRATPFDPKAAIIQSDDEGRFLLRCLAVAGFAAANIMLLSVAVWAGAGGEMGPATRMMMHWISGMIAIPAAAFAGRPFFNSALAALKKGRANMDVPISLAVLLSLAVSIFETLNHGHDAYFDAAVMLLFFLLIGRWLDHRLRARAREAARGLIAMQATAATRFRHDGTLEAVSARDIGVGERILLSPGDRAPVNGVIETGASEVDVSLVTGESAPASMKSGDTLYAGVLNLSSKLVMRATARVEDSLLADLTRLIEAGEQGKSKYVRLADRAAALYVPVVHSLALATFLGWLVIGDAGLRVAIMNAVAVLIITCPCALGLAAPAVQVVATGRLFKSGVLVKSGDALERLAEVDTFVFDKTGTLTLGRMSLANRDEISEAVLMQAASLARVSRHPLARAIVDAAGPGALANEVRDVPGYGVEGVIGDSKARFGRADWVGAVSGDQSALSEAWFKLGDAEPVRFTFEDRLRNEAAQSIVDLRDKHIESEMMTGDRRAPAERIAKSVGLNTWRAEMTPADKISRLSALSAIGAKTAMVGDGLNDAPALSAAHASLSPGTAADASQAAADFVFQGDSLRSVVTAYDISVQARRRVLENFAFAALYNVCAIPLAVFGFVTPLIAALAMSGSSVVVTLNALRIRNAKETA